MSERQNQTEDTSRCQTDPEPELTPKAIMDVIRRANADRPNRAVTVARIKTEFTQIGVNPKEFDGVYNLLKRNGEIYEPSQSPPRVRVTVTGASERRASNQIVRTYRGP